MSCSVAGEGETIVMGCTRLNCARLIGGTDSAEVAFDGAVGAEKGTEQEGAEITALLKLLSHRVGPALPCQAAPWKLSTEAFKESREGWRAGVVNAVCVECTVSPLLNCNLVGTDLSRWPPSRA